MTRPSEVYLEQLVNGANLDAATNYYPNSAGWEVGVFQDVTLSGVISGGVTATVEATMDGSDWLDITKGGFNLLTGVFATANFVDTNFALQFNGLNVKAVRVKSVTADGSNAVQYDIRARVSA